MIQLNNMITETRNPKTLELDAMSTQEILQVMNEEDQGVALVVHKVLDKVEQAIAYITESFENGGRLIYIGAGTSGRLGVLDAVECPPTFGTAPGQVVGLIAGGDGAFVKAVEDAEDNKTLARQELEAIHLTDKDTVVGVAASGRTPYVIGGLIYAHTIGAHTIAIACNENSEIGQHAEVAIEVVSGPEILTGSTRLKAGTAQKLIMNMLSTVSMIKVGKVYQNLMVDVQQTNEKLRVRTQNIVMEATGCTREHACWHLKQAGGEAKIAITMILLGCDKEQALERLKRAKGHIRGAIGG